MRYTEAYSFFLQGPKWVVNLLLGAVCLFVPVAGPMVLMGWAFDELQRANRSQQDYPFFDVNKLGKYLMRGLWPVLVQLIISLPFAALVMVVWFGLIAGMGAASGPGNAPPPWFAFAVLCYILAILVLSVVVQMIAVPMCLRAAMMQDFGAAFSFSWAIGFIQRTWGQMILCYLFIFASGIIVSLVGLLLCCVGIYPASALITLAQYHLWFQLYDLYLARGGEPIPWKVEPMDTHIRADEN